MTAKEKAQILEEFINILADNLEEEEFDHVIDVLDNAGVFNEENEEIFKEDKEK